jgi:ferric-dicitrate binding protein FerR (iron transport regulator)
MDDDYLWDRSGKPDPDVTELERALAPLRYVERDVPAPAKVVPLAASGPKPQAPAEPRRRRWVPVLLAAAAIAAGAFVVLRRPPSEKPIEVRRVAPLVPTVSEPEPSEPAFAVTRLAGAPRVGGAAIEGEGQLRVGEWLETDAASRARLEVATIGRIEVEEGTRLRLTATGPDQHRLDLDRGFISARVVAPPRVFVVGTPAATAVDLGCAYTLRVDDRGAGLLRVTWGWVALEEGTRTSFVPAGASCSTRPGQGPGTPAFDDASAALREALLRFDFEGGGEAEIRSALGKARKRDALSVWHLLARVDEPLRRDVYRRLAALFPPPHGVTEAAALRLDPEALDAWRNALIASEMPITW